PKRARIDERLAPQQHGQRQIAINAATPLGLAKRVEARGMLAVEQRFRLSITLLLADIGLHRVAPEMPDERGGTVADHMPRILQAPANVDIVARRPEDRVEAADAKQH